MVLVGTRLVRAGRGDLAFRGAVAFSVIFALSVQWFLFRWPDWMYAYFVPATELSPGAVAPFFFVAVVGCGVAGAFLSWTLVRQGRTGWAVANVAFGLGGWLAIQAATWDRYFHVGTFAQYQAGLAPRLSDAGTFSVEMNVAGVIQALSGIGIAFALIRAGRSRLPRSRIQPDPGGPWRQAVGISPGPSLAAVEGARQAQVRWARIEPEERARKLRRLGQAFLLRADEASKILEEELGRPVAESFFTEILPNADLFDHWVRQGLLQLQPSRIALDPFSFQKKEGIVERVPLGVVAVISPWNFPLSLPLRTIVPALLAGNTVVLKPSEHVARISGLLVDTCASVLGEGVVTLVEGGAEEAQAVIQAGVDHVVFIGSPVAGRKVAEAAAARLTPCSLELGGKDAALVRADADLERAANGIVWGAFVNAGQNCAAIERCYVDRKVLAPFVQKLREKVRALVPGRDLGRIATDTQWQKLQSLLEDARERGVEVAVSGHDRSLAPIVLVDPPTNLALLHEEIFGPVLCVVGVAGDEELVEKANDSAYGLTASVWSRDVTAAEALARRLLAGVVTVNNHGFTGGLAQAPFGGVRASGGGVIGGAEMMAKLTRPRLVLVDRHKGPKELWWHPYDATALRLGRAMARLRTGRWDAALEVLAALRQRRSVAVARVPEEKR